MLIEKEKLRSRTTPLLIEFQEKGNTTYKPILVNKVVHDDVTRFIVEETDRLKERLNNLRTTPGGRSKSKRVMRNIREDRQKIIDKGQIERKLLVLKGEMSQPIRLISKNNRITKLELVSFDQKGQKEYWEYIKTEAKVNKVIELTKIYPEGFEVLSELFNIRSIMKHGSLKQAERVKEDNISLISRIGEIPDDRDDILVLLVPLTKMITEKFGN